MEIKYAEIEIEKLQFGVFRPPSWWNKHPKHKEFQKKIIQSIMKDGLKNPISVVNQNDDGFFVCTVGNQRLQALKTMNVKMVPCVLGYKPGQQHIPPGNKIDDFTSLEKYFSVPLKQVILNQNTFHAVPEDVHEWDPDKT